MAKLKSILKGVWQFYSYLFIPQRYSDDIQYGAWKEYEVCGGNHLASQVRVNNEE